MSKGLLTVLLAILMGLVASALLVSAADAALPGDWAYGIDRAMESLRLRLALDHKQHALVQQQLALERLREAQTLERRGDTQSVEALRQEARLALLSAKTTNPKKPQKTEKPNNLSAQKTPEPPQIESRGKKTGQTKHARGGEFCNEFAETNHPEGDKLAAEFNVSYTEIIGWFCQGYGFGEIALAYQISAQAGVTAENVFDMRENGMNWGKIKRYYGLIGGSSGEIIPVVA